MTLPRIHYDPWFHDNPLDLMPIATDKPIEEWEDDGLDYEDQINETIHEKMYKIATSKYNPFSVGGSENCDSDISCNIGGSESASRF